MAEKSIPFYGIDQETGKEIADSHGALKILNERATLAGLPEITYAQLQSLARSKKAEKCIEIVRKTGKNVFYGVQSLKSIELADSSQVGKRGKENDNELKRHALQMSAAGKSNAEIGRALGLHRNIVRSWVLNAQDHVEKDARQLELQKKAVALYTQGLTLQQVTQRLNEEDQANVSATTVRVKFLAGAGVERRPRFVSSNKEVQ